MMAAASAALAGKTILITGGARRVGAAMARELHAAGANIVIHYRRSERDARELAASLDNLRADSCAACGADLADVAAHGALVAQALGRFGRLDVLVNNASSFYPTPIGRITPAEWDDLVGSNLRAPLFLSQAAAEPLRAARGLILNMIDIHGLRPLRHHTVYSAAKAGLVMLTRSLARELGPEVRVNGIAPGPVMWPDGGISDELKREIIDKTALKRAGSAEDVARTALFLVRDAPFITGQIIAVDGGRSI